MEYPDEWKKANVVPTCIIRRTVKMMCKPIDLAISLLSNMSKSDGESSVYKIIHLLDDQPPTNMEEFSFSQLGWNSEPAGQYCTQLIP